MSELIQKAEEFATKAHEGQLRKHGNRPYIYHPACVARYLEEKNYTDDVIAAAWLHDTVEDTGTTYNTLEKEFGPEVSRLVWEVSHPVLQTKWSRYQRWQIYLIHYESASSLGQTLKLADRYCNLKEYMDFWNDVPNKDRNFLRIVYLEESGDLLDSLNQADRSVYSDLLYMINYLDELCSEE